MDTKGFQELLLHVRAVKQQDSHINLKIVSQMNKVDPYFRVGRDRWGIGSTETEFVLGATGKKEDVVKERKDGTLKKISAGVDKFLEELSKIGGRL
nr:hypothetical protein [Tanacetum cinerariifolium]